MFRAIEEETGKEIFAENIVSDDQRRVKYVCPITNSSVVYVRGHERHTLDVATCVVPYFRHKTAGVIISSEYYNDDDLFKGGTSDSRTYGESMEHRLGKKMVAAHISDLYKKKHPGKDIKISYELRVEIQDRWRIIDVAAVFPNGLIEAYEVQLSSISDVDLEQRTNDYLSVGIEVVWLFGKKAHTESNKDWHLNRFGFRAYTLSFP